MRVLITDGDTRQALAATRSLGRSGHSVVVAAERLPCLAGTSRHAAAAVRCPSGTTAPGGFASSIAGLARQFGIEIVIPMTEISTLLLTQARDRLPPACILPFPSHASVRRAGNKAEVLELARRVGLPIPETATVHSPAEAATVANGGTFPLVVKPACSRVLTADGWISNSVSYARDPDELSKQLAGLRAESFPVLLQERIQGPGIGIFLLFDRGRPVARFSHRRLREKPPSGGVSVLCESVPVEPMLAAPAEALLRKLEWHGPAMVEFKRDERDGMSRLMEINARFWGSLQLAIDAGVDFPSLLVDIAQGTPPAAAPAYTCGVRSRWLGGDLDALLMTLMRPRRQLNLPTGHPGRLQSLWSFLDPWQRNTRLEIERWADLRPAAYEWRQRLTGS